MKNLIMAKHPTIKELLTLTLLLFTILILGSLTGCSSDDSSDNPDDTRTNPTPAAPTSQQTQDAILFCRQLVSQTCERVLACTTGTTQAQCLEQAQYSDCPNVTHKGPNAAQCLADLKASSCQTFIVNGGINLPVSCAGVLQ